MKYVVTYSLYSQANRMIFLLKKIIWVMLLVTDVSTTCAEAIFRVCTCTLSKRQSLTTVLLRTPITQMIFFNQGMLLLGSKHFLIFKGS